MSLILIVDKAFVVHEEQLAAELMTELHNRCKDKTSLFLMHHSQRIPRVDKHRELIEEKHL